MVTNSKIAVDVAILPPDNIADKLIGINKQAAAKNMAWGPLGKEDFLPHLSLAMGCVQYDDLGTMKGVVEAVVAEFDPIPIELYELYYAEMSNGAKMYCLRAKKTPKLQRLHENMVNGLQRYFSHDCVKESLYSKPGEEVVEPDYINKFHSSHTFQAFDPHVTLRIKEEAGRDALPITFTANWVAACHVGIITTCRKKIFAVPIKTR